MIQKRIKLFFSKFRLPNPAAFYKFRFVDLIIPFLLYAITVFFQSLNAKKDPRFWLDAAAEGFVLSDVFLPDGDATFEFDLNLRLSDDDLFDERSHDGCVTFYVSLQS